MLIWELFMSETQQPELSVVIPVFNEEDSVGQLYTEIVDALADFSYEVIFVDDGSTDKSFTVLTEIQKNRPNVWVIRFRRNFGQTAAMSAGFKFSRKMILRISLVLSKNSIRVSILSAAGEKIAKTTLSPVHFPHAWQTG